MANIKTINKNADWYSNKRNNLSYKGYYAYKQHAGHWLIQGSGAYLSSPKAVKKFIDTYLRRIGVEYNPLIIEHKIEVKKFERPLAVYGNKQHHEYDYA